LKTSYQITRLLSQARSLRDGAPGFLKTVCEDSGWLVGELWLAAVGRDEIRLEEPWHGGDREAKEFVSARRGVALERGHGLLGRVWASGEPLWTLDLAGEPGLSQSGGASKSGIRAGIAFPIRRGDDIAGVLAFYRVSDARPNEDLLRRMGFFTEQFGLFLSRVRAEETLHAAKEAAEEANRAKDRFLAVLSHELRTPLTPVVAILESWERRTDIPEEIAGSISVLLRNIEMEAVLIDDLLDLTKVSQGKIELQTRAVDVHRLLGQVVEMCRPDLNSKKLRVGFSLRAEACHVEGDSARLHQVFWNILRNAIKFTPEEGSIEISTRDAGDGAIVVEVRDTGIGIKAQVLHGIFNAFVQGDNTATRRYGGLGLGLAISKALVEMHGGKISARSAGKGKGATFSVELKTVGDPGKLARPNPPTRPPSILRRRVSILLVEDHRDTAEALASLLREEGDAVTVADSLEAAIMAADKAIPDLLITDVGLPDGSGLDLLRRLNRIRRVPGIVLSGYGMEKDIRASRSAGFVEHLTKPVHIAKLSAVIDRIVAEGPGPKASG
jgi:signal transduction histidine kinase/CheY-like chemotaxis protein